MKGLANQDVRKEAGRRGSTEAESARLQRLTFVRAGLLNLIQIAEAKIIDFPGGMGNEASRHKPKFTCIES